MSHINIEIKARCADPAKVRAILRERKADFKGADRQTDTYFNAPNGRLKLRQGDIENTLIYYRRPDAAGPKEAQVHLYPLADGAALKQLLAAALGIRKVVRKQREIYFIGNVKFHIDAVDGLGEFVEIEAIDAAGRLGRARLLRQCREYMELFGISQKDLVSGSYSDMPTS